MNDQKEENSAVREIGAVAQGRASALLVEKERGPQAYKFIKECLDNNERGDGSLYAALNRDRYLYNTTPKDGEWYAWQGNVWQRDDFRGSFDDVEQVALEYQRMAEALKEEISSKGITQKHAESWKIELRQKYKRRVDRLRSAAGASRVLFWAPVVDQSMACREQDFDKQPHLLPVQNGVIDLTNGALIQGRPEDKLTRMLDLEYDYHADYTAWEAFVREICGDDSVAAFIKRSLGYAITGFSHEQHIWVFTGPGRNGKGVLFDLVMGIMGPYAHTISRAMLIEQRNEPSPSAASEHKYSLLGKRIVVGGETNRGQRIDSGAVKGLTGDDDIVCRPNFKSEIVFKPTHTLFLHTNNVPAGLTRDFALVQRLIKIQFPYMYVDDPDAEAARNPSRADKYRKKDPHLKDRLRKCRPGILRWLVEGAMEWHRDGLGIPDAIREEVSALAAEEDFTGRFLESCLQREDDTTRISCQEMYKAFRWWWAGNEEEEGSKRIPAMKTINNNLRERGVRVEAVGGKTWIYGYCISLEIAQDVMEFSERRNS